MMEKLTKYGAFLFASFSVLYLCFIPKLLLLWKLFLAYVEWRWNFQSTLNMCLRRCCSDVLEWSISASASSTPLPPFFCGQGCQICQVGLSSLGNNRALNGPKLVHACYLACREQLGQNGGSIVTRIFLANLTSLGVEYGADALHFVLRCPKFILLYLSVG